MFAPFVDGLELGHQFMSQDASMLAGFQRVLCGFKKLDVLFLAFPYT
jgi:hypothetical protein